MLYLACCNVQNNDDRVFFLSLFLLEWKLDCMHALLFQIGFGVVLDEWMQLLLYNCFAK